MLIASTAHYGKFIEPVMESLNLEYKDDIKLNFKELEKLNAINPFHKKLYSVLEKEIIHKDVVEADIELIKNLIKIKIKSFY
jgi:hypothetical protein